MRLTLNTPAPTSCSIQGSCTMRSHMRTDCSVRCNSTCTSQGWTVDRAVLACSASRLLACRSCRTSRASTRPSSSTNWLSCSRIYTSYCGLQHIRRTMVPAAMRCMLGASVWPVDGNAKDAIGPPQYSGCTSAASAAMHQPARTADHRTGNGRHAHRCRVAVCSGCVPDDDGPRQTIALVHELEQRGDERGSQQLVIHARKQHGFLGQPRQEIRQRLTPG